jgi:hypothetical protein
MYTPHRAFFSLADLRAGAQFLRGLPAFLRNPIGLEEARANLHRRLEHREPDFLHLVRRTIYQHPRSPYRPLLNLAGCEYGDLKRLVREDGLEGALQNLYRHGVYLTVDEFKGKRPIVRGNTTFAVNPSQFHNPLSVSHVPARTSGSRSGGTPVLIDLAFVRDCAVNKFLALNARNGVGWAHALWCIPGGGALVQLLRLSGFGAPWTHWFSQVDPAALGLHPRYRWSGWLLRWASLLAGVPLPRPRYVPLSNPLPIASWMAEVRRAGGTPNLFTFPSSAVRLCQVAREAGLDLSGAYFTLVGEPFTEARLATIRRSGARAAPRYSSIESGPVGYACLAAEAADDLHLLHDLQALIQPGPDAQISELPGNSLLLSSLRLTTPFILLNVSLGDQGVLVRRTCGCPLERLGWPTHLHTIRSFEKLTAGGMTFPDTDLIPVLEEVLPSRFGGAPTDYQLVEEEAANGQPCVRLLVHPAVGPLDPGAVAEAFLTAISRGSGVERVMGLAWRQANFLRVERRAPLATATGKILHLHVEHGP